MLLFLDTITKHRSKFSTPYFGRCNEFGRCHHQRQCKANESCVELGDW